MTNGQLPPVVKYSEIKKYFRREIRHDLLAKWEESGVIHPFRATPSSRALYYTRELQQIFEPNTICQPSRQTN